MRCIRLHDKRGFPRTCEVLCRRVPQAFVVHTQQLLVIEPRSILISQIQQERGLSE
jgi:hypothetical protein